MTSKKDSPGSDLRLGPALAAAPPEGFLPLRTTADFAGLLLRNEVQATIINRDIYQTSEFLTYGNLTYF